MEYNTQRPQMKIPDYGRNVQKMIEYATTVEDREKRNQLAQAIIMVMGQLNPHLRDVSDFNHKLWDHLFIISGFQLDVDSPYPKPSPESLLEKPEKLKYPSQDIKYKHYGKNIELLIEKAAGMEDGEAKTAFISAIANLMKKFYLTWNRDTVTDDVIFKQLAELSKGKLKTENLQLTASSDILARTGTPSIHKSKKKGKNIKNIKQKQKKY